MAEGLILVLVFRFMPSGLLGTAVGLLRTGQPNRRRTALADTRSAA
jgi:hypothetical protein